MKIQLKQFSLQALLKHIPLELFLYPILVYQEGDLLSNEWTATFIDHYSWELVNTAHESISVNMDRSGKLHGPSLECSIKNVRRPYIEATMQFQSLDDFGMGGNDLLVISVLEKVGVKGKMEDQLYCYGVTNTDRVYLTIDDGEQEVEVGIGNIRFLSQIKPYTKHSFNHVSFLGIGEVQQIDED
jgi:hypothetical protein